MNTSSQVLCFVLFYFFQFASSAAVGKLPPFFEVCHTKEPQFDICLLNAVEKAVHSLVKVCRAVQIAEVLKVNLGRFNAFGEKLKNTNNRKNANPALNQKELGPEDVTHFYLFIKGYPPLGIYSIDPLEIVELDIDQGNGPISIKLKFKNLKISGFSDAKLSDIKYDVKNYRYSAIAKVPKVTLKGKYNINGKVLILPITGNGTCVLTLDNVVAHIALVGKESTKDGRIYMITDHFNFKFDTSRLSMKFENLFGGDKQLGNNMNEFLNQNWQEILAELKPAIQEVFGAAFAEISNRIFTKVPYNDIFPE